MAISESGLYGLTLQKFLNGTSLPTSGLDSETAVRCLMVTDTYTPNYNTHDFRDDITNEVSGTGYTAGGNVLTTTSLAVASGVLTYDAADTSWAASTISNAMGAVGFFQVGADLTTPADDALIFLSDFVTAASSSSGTFTIQWSGSGIFTVDFVPGA